MNTLLRINWLNLQRDTVALGLTFVLPIIFFSIFASMFSGMGGGGVGVGGDNAIDVLVVDEDDSEVSRRFLDTLRQTAGLNIITTPGATAENPSPVPYTRDAARQFVRGGGAPAAAIILPGFGAGFGDFAGTAAGKGGAAVQLIYDPADPIARFAVSGLMQAASFRAAPDILMERGLGALDSLGAGLTPPQQRAIEQLRPFLRGERPWDEMGQEEPSADLRQPTSGGGSEGLIRVEPVNVRADEATRRQPSMIPYYAAGIGVMFLLFSMAGAAGSLLEEQEAGVLDRLLTAGCGMGRLLASKWIFFTLMGFAQVSIMFLWGALVFGLELFTPNRLAGFTVMALTTAAAASAFGLVLATISRSRAQLGGLSTIIILIMSAVGGSMIPRMFMPDAMKTAGKFTFNGQALDGFLQVFWNDDASAGLLPSLLSIAPQTGILAGMAATFLILARRFAARWEIG